MTHLRNTPQQLGDGRSTMDLRARDSGLISCGSSTTPAVDLSDSSADAPTDRPPQVHDRRRNDGSTTLQATPSTATQFSPPALLGSVAPAGAGSPEVDEAVRNLLSRRDFGNGQPIPCSIGVVSPVGGEGVSTIAATLAEILRSDYGARVCLLNFSAPEATSAPSATPGLLAEVAGGLKSIERIEALDFDTLDFGRLPAPQWHALAHSEAFAKGLAALRRSRDHLVFDIPPVLSSSSSMVVLRRVEAYVLVARHGVTSVSDIETTVSALAGLESLGSVLNCHRSRVPRWFGRWLPTN